jgi:ATP-binding cassette subfamily F protein 3
MDEPTNHLDIWSCDALERSIEEFEGTVLVVTHDRYFLNQVADRLIVLGGGKARVIEGDYETYQRLAQQEADAAQARAAASAAASTQSRDGDRVKPEKRRRKFPYRKTDDLEREIAEVEAKVSTVEDLLGQPATWRDPIKARSTQQDHEELKSRLARLYEHWEEAVELNS